MDSTAKSEYLESEQVTKTYDSGLVLEDKKRKWDSQLMYTTQQLAAQFTPWINAYQHIPVGINWRSPKISKKDCSVGTSENLKSAKIQDFTPLPSWHTPQISNDDCCNETSKGLNNAKTQELTPPTPNTAIKCYVCDEQVLRSEFALHLFFGELKCKDCEIKVFDCKSFRSDLFRSSNCTHKHINWSENPLEYLKSQLHVISKSDYKKVYHYVKRLKSLEQLLPWKSAFLEYRRLKKLESYSEIKCEPVVCNKNKHVEKNIDTICDANNCEVRNIDTICDTNKYEGENIDTINDTNTYEGTNINTNDNCDEVLLLESYDLDQMEDAVQVIGLEDQQMFQENYTFFKSESEIPENKHNIKTEQMINEKLDTLHANDTDNTKLNENTDIMSRQKIGKILDTSHSNGKNITKLNEDTDIMSRQIINERVDTFHSNDKNMTKLCEEIDILSKKMINKRLNTSYSNDNNITNLKEDIDIMPKQMINRRIDISHSNENNIINMSEDMDIMPRQIINRRLDTLHSNDRNITNLREDKDIKDTISRILSVQRRESINDDNILKKLLKGKLIKKIKKKIKSEKEKEIISKEKQLKKTECKDKKTKLNLTESKPLKRKRKKHRKKVNVRNESVKEPLPLVSETLPLGSEIELLDTPENGNYLITHTPIEECPMCYKKIKVTNCSVNIKLLLYTFWCKCGLKIFYLRKTPAKIEHPVKIILDK